jgi:TPR repeat protein
MASNAGSAYAMGNLSRLYDWGLGTRADPKEAVRWAAASVEGGDPSKLEELKTSPDNFTPAFRKEIQALLKDRGLYSGPLDGDFGAATQNAIDRLAKKS